MPNAKLGKHETSKYGQVSDGWESGKQDSSRLTVTVTRLARVYTADRNKVKSCLKHPIPQGFSIIILKPYVKAVTHSEKLEWWNIVMVECVTILLCTSVE